MKNVGCVWVVEYERDGAWYPSNYSRADRIDAENKKVFVEESGFECRVVEYVRKEDGQDG